MHSRLRLILSFAFGAVYLASQAESTPLPQGQIQEDTGQVSINESPSNNDTETNLPIVATIFGGVPGPKKCRGSPMAAINLPPPQGLGLTTQAHCYNLPGVAGCGNFVANKADGCEARLFAEPACRSYVNTVVFIPEDRAVGGSWRSISVQCGVPAPDPDSLGAPPLADMIMKQTPRTNPRRDGDATF